VNCIETKWIEIVQDNLRIGTAKAVARLISIVQIICYCNWRKKTVSNWYKRLWV